MLCLRGFGFGLVFDPMVVKSMIARLHGQNPAMMLISLLAA